MAYIGNRPVSGDNNSFRVLDDIKTHTFSFDGSSSSVVSTSDDTITHLGHRLIQGQRVTYTDGTGSPIGGLTDGTVYFVVINDANSFKLASSASNAAAGTGINLTSVGSGTSHNITVAFDGVNTKFKATYNNGTEADVTRVAQIQISLNNVIQEPQNTATPTSGFGFDTDSVIVFATAPASNATFWGVLFANNFPTFEISDNDVDSFTGDGSATEFSLSKSPATNENIIVTIDGVVQYPSDNSTTRAYNTVGNALQFSVAPHSDADIQARHIGFAGPDPSVAGVTAFYGRTGSVFLNSSDSIVVNDAEVTGNLTVQGDTTTLNTTLRNVELLRVDGNDTVAAGIITQRGSGDILKLYDTSSSVFVVQDGGNVRIGDNASVSTSNAGDDLVVGNLTGGHGITIVSGQANGNLNFADSGSGNAGAIMYNHSENTMRFRVAGDEKLRISSTGKVGIGTDDPTSKLDLIGDVKITGIVTASSFVGGLPITNGADNRVITATSASAIQGEAGLTFDGTTLTNAGSGFKGITIAPNTNNSATLRLQNNQKNFSVSNVTGGKFAIADGNTQRFVIDGSGEVGIGTDNPASALDVRNASGTNPLLSLHHSNADTLGEIIRIGRVDLPTIRYHSIKAMHGGAATNNYISFNLHNGDTTTSQKEVLRIVGDGKVGIGTDDPDAPLHVQKVNGTIAIFGDSGPNDATFERIAIKNDVTSYPAISNDSSNDTLDLRSMGSVQATIDSNGNSTGKYFRVMTNDTGDSGTELFRVGDDGEVRIADGGLLTINAAASGNYAVSEALRVDDNNSTGDRALQIFEYHHNGGRWHSFNQNLNVTTTGTSYTYTQGNYGGSTMMQMINGHLRIFNNPEVVGGGTSAITPIERFTILSGGNVGIGTDNPSQKLDVRGDIIAYENSSGSVRLVQDGNIEITNNNGGIIDFKTGDNEDFDCRIRQMSNGLQFMTGGNGSTDEVVRITSDGKVGIGTDNPARDFHVVGTSRFEQLDIVGFTTFATGTKFFHHTPQIFMQGNNTATLSFVNATTGTTNSDGMLMGFSSSSQVGFINVNEPSHGFVIKTGGSAVSAERLRISGVGTFSIRNGTEEMVNARPNLGVELYFNGNKRLETTSSGVSIGGTTIITPASSGKLGIGTDNPDERLHVVVTSATATVAKFERSHNNNVSIEYKNTTSKMYAGLAGDALGWAVDDDANLGNSPMFIVRRDTSRVGIGSLIPADRLDVHGNAIFGEQSTADGQIQIGRRYSGNRNAYVDLIGDDTYHDYGFRVIRKSDGENAESQIDHRGTGDFTISATEAATIRFSITGSERVRIASDGSFGVGTISPDSALHVYKQINDRTARFQRISSQHIDIEQTAGINSFLSTGKNFEIGTTDSQDLIFDTVGSERLRIDSDGHIKIPDDAEIRLGGAQTTSGVIKIYSESGTSDMTHIDATSGNGKHIRFIDSISGHTQTELYFGNAQKLSTQPGGILVQGTVSGTTGLITNNDGDIEIGTRSRISAASGTCFVLENSNSGGDEVFRITSTGEVGIGTADPLVKLHVDNPTALGGTSGNKQEIARFEGNVSNNGILEFSNMRLSNGSDWESSAFRIQRIIDVTRMGYIDFGTGAGSGAGGDGRNIQFGSGDGTLMMHLDSEGKVGIGTAAPVKELDIVGDAAIEGSLFLSDVSGQIVKFSGAGGNLDVFSDGTIDFIESDNNKTMVTFDVNTTHNDARIYMESDSDTYWNHPDSNQFGFTMGGNELLRLTSSIATIKGFNGTGLRLEGSGSDYQGMQLQVTDASASQTRNIFIDVVNENGKAVANQVGQIQSDGGSKWTWATQPPGTSRTADNARQDRFHITANGSIGINQHDPSASLDVRPAIGTGLGETAGDEVNIAEFGSGSNATGGANDVKLLIQNVRLSNGNNWTTTTTRIQRRVDVTDQSYIDFGTGGGADGGDIELGYGSRVNVHIDNAGGVGIASVSSNDGCGVIKYMSGTSIPDNAVGGITVKVNAGDITGDIKIPRNGHIMAVTSFTDVAGTHYPQPSGAGLMYVDVGPSKKLLLITSNNVSGNLRTSDSMVTDITTLTSNNVTFMPGSTDGTIRIANRWTTSPTSSKITFYLTFM